MDKEKAQQTILEWNAEENLRLSNQRAKNLAALEPSIWRQSLFMVIPILLFLILNWIFDGLLTDDEPWLLPSFILYCFLMAQFALIMRRQNAIIALLRELYKQDS